MNRDIPKFDVLDDETAAKYRSMTPAEKIQMASDMNQAARKRAAARLKHEHADWDEQQVNAEVARLMLSGDEVYFK
jgi:hypothetical protein